MHDRPLHEFLLGDPDRAHIVEWLDDEVERLESTRRKNVTMRLRTEEQFQSTLHELAAGTLLRQSGYSADYDPEIDGLTPDWYVARGPGRVPFVVEVVTRTNPHSAERRKWSQLKGRLEKLSAPWAIGVRLPLPRAPAESAQKQIVRSVSAWLAEDTVAERQERTINGCQLVIVGRSPFKDGLYFGTPSPEAGSVDHDELIDRIRDKGSKYRALCEKHDLPLVVVIASDMLNGHSADGFELVLSARQHVHEAWFDVNSIGLILDVTSPMSPPPERRDPFGSVVSLVLLMEASVQRIRWTPFENPVATRPLNSSHFATAPMRYVNRGPA
jgi:hypothetical protein